MTITAWRIVSEKRRSTAFDGEGARLYGGRFNSRGTPVVYASTALALAMLELLVHLDRARALARYAAVPIEFDGALLRYVDPADLPDDWRAPVTPISTQRFGDAWVQREASVALAVPSVLLPEAAFGSEHNILLNPRHERFSSVVIGEPEPLPIESRLR